MAMRRRDLAGQDELKAGEERFEDAVAAAEPRILQGQHPPVRLLGGDERPALEQDRANDIVIVPEMRGRLDLVLRRWRHEPRRP
jgi:hypothetical protein